MCQEHEIVAAGVPNPDTMRSVTLTRNVHGGDFGIVVAAPVTLMHDDDTHDAVYVSATDEEACRTGLRVGDRVLSIDGERCCGRLQEDVVGMLLYAADKVEVSLCRALASVPLAVP